MQEEKPPSLEQQPAAFRLLRMNDADLGKEITSCKLLKRSSRESNTANDGREQKTYDCVIIITMHRWQVFPTGGSEDTSKSCGQARFKS